MPRFPRFLAILTAAALAAPALPGKASAQDAATVIARVGEVELTLGHAVALLAELPEQIRAAPAERLLPALVGQMIDQELLAQAQAGNELSLVHRLQQENSQRDFLANVLLEGVVSSAVDDASLQAAYAAFAEAFEAGEPTPEWNAAHILVREEDEITAVVEELEAGRDFAELAAEASIDGSGQQGGELGWFGPGVMIPEFEEVVRSLEPGQISDPLESRFGWHVVRLLDTRMAGVPPLEQVRDELAQQLQRQAVTLLIEDLRAETGIEDLSGDLDPELLRRSDLLAE